MRAIFLPVWSMGVTQRVFKVFDKFPRKDWFDQYPINHAHSLLAYPDWSVSRQPMEIPEGSYTFGDSGGFTLIKKPDLVLDAVDVLRWQATNTNVGAILDLPPKGVARRDWTNCLEYTERTVAKTRPVYEQYLNDGSKFRWWGVLHGANEREAQQWYDRITAIYPFDKEGEGWAVYPGPRASPDTVARTMRLLKYLGIKRAHFLACTGQDVIASILALGPKAGLELVTFDSMSHAVAAFNHWWFMLGTEGVTGATRRSKFSDLVFENVRCLGERVEELSDACQCKTCAWVRENQPRPSGEAATERAMEAHRLITMIFHNVNLQNECIARMQTAMDADVDVGFATALATSGGYKQSSQVIEADGTMRVEKADIYDYRKAKIAGERRARIAMGIFTGDRSDPVRNVKSGSNLGLLADL